MKSCCILAILILSQCLSCATVRESILLGAVIGVPAGAAFGYGIKRRPTPIVIGATVGLVGGGLFGFLLHKDRENKETELLKKNRATTKYPFLNKPEVRSIWIPDKIEGNKFEEGHFIYLIDKPSSWSQE